MTEDLLTTSDMMVIYHQSDIYCQKKEINSAKMDENIYNKIGIKKSSKQNEKIFYLAGGIIFGIGYLMLIINGYYHYKSVEFIQIGRQDLIARLGFLSFANGIIFYPTSIILITIIIWMINKRGLRGMLRKSLFAILGLVLPGIFFYSGLKLNILFGPKEKWIMGIALIAISILILKNKSLKI